MKELVSIATEKIDSAQYILLLRFYIGQVQRQEEQRCEKGDTSPSALEPLQIDYVKDPYFRCKVKKKFGW